MYMSTQNGCPLATFLIETESRDIWANSKRNMAVMASDGPSTHSPSLHLGQPGPPAIETPPHPVPAGPLISWPKNASCIRILPQASRASLPLRRWATTCSRLSLHPCPARLYLVACNPSSNCLFWILDHLCSNLFQSFTLAESWSFNLCVCYTFSSSAFAFR